jgi:RNA polymerase sigma-70 factor (ECF subfamily)
VIDACATGMSVGSTIEKRRGSVLQALHLLFNEGYHGSNPREPVRPSLCTDAVRLAELLLDTSATAHPDVSALAALFCFDLARLATRLDAEGCSSRWRNRIGAGGTGR